MNFSFYYPSFLIIRLLTLIIKTIIQFTTVSQKCQPFEDFWSSKKIYVSHLIKY